MNITRRLFGNFRLLGEYLLTRIRRLRSRITPLTYDLRTRNRCSGKSQNNVFTQIRCSTRLVMSKTEVTTVPELSQTTSKWIQTIRIWCNYSYMAVVLVFLRIPNVDLSSMHTRNIIHTKAKAIWILNHIHACLFHFNKQTMFILRQSCVFM